MSAWDIHSLVEPSRVLRGLGTAAYGLAAAAVLMTTMPVAVQGLLLAVIVAGLLVALNRWRLHGQDAIRELHWTDEGIRVVTSAGQRMRVVIRRPTVWPAVVILPLESRDTGWKETLLLFADGLPPDQWRKLQTRLRLDRRDAGEIRAG